VSISNSGTTQPSGLRWGFETASKHFQGIHIAVVATFIEKMKENK
jgi:hypothetical protein